MFSRVLVANRGEIAVTRPALSAFSSLNSFIASSRQSVWPGATTSPTSTNGGVPGSGWR